MLLLMPAYIIDHLGSDGTPFLEVVVLLAVTSVGHESVLEQEFSIEK